MGENSEEQTTNVLISALIIGVIIILLSMLILFLVTKNIYLDAYYTIETFFDTPNTTASFSLAALAFTYGLPSFILVVGIVVLDNLGKILVISFVIAAVLDIIKYANVEESINRFRASRLSDHIIICDYNDITRDLIPRLTKKKAKFLVLTSDPNIAMQLNRDHVPTLTGKFTESHYLKLASIERATAIVFTSQTDLDNLIGAITARKLNKKIRIMSRVRQEEVRKKMLRAGIEMCVLPEYLAGIDLGEKMAKAIRDVKYAV